MLFKSIEICNFGRYSGKNFFDTTVTQDRNVILVRAKNDRGKTTLFQAIKFALYGQDGIKPKSVSDWINFQTASEGNGEMYVELKFDHEGSVYRLKRAVKFKHTERGKEIATEGNPRIDLFKDGNPYMISDDVYNKKEWIDTILPKDASQFFFFDGEEIQRYIQKEETHVKQAIEKVLGITELLNAKEDLQIVSQNFQNDYYKNIRKHDKDQKSQSDLDRIQNDLLDCQTTIEAETKAKKGAERTKTDLEKDQKKYKAIQDIVDERSNVEEEIQKLEHVLKDQQKELATSMGNVGLVLISPLLLLINKTEEDPPTLDRWQSDAVKFITKHMDKCVCDRNIDEHVREVFKSKILDLKPSKKSMLKKFINRIMVDHNPDAKMVTLQNNLEAVANTRQEIAKHNSTVKTLNKKIRGNERIENAITELQDKWEDVIKDIGTHENRILRYKQDKMRLENDRSKIASKINSSVVDEQLTQATTRKTTGETIVKCIDQSIEKFYDTRKSALEEDISNIFSSLTNNPDLYRGLTIERDFSMKVVRKDGTTLPTYKYGPSAGASQIVATSMIGGLNKFATRDAPVVIDTPMGRLDPEHRKNLINYYSKMSKQIIILYQPSELASTDIQHIHDSLASEWVIDSKPDSPDLSYLHRERVHCE